jgi:transcriptional regulator with XRE-family HTH domain
MGETVFEQHARSHTHRAATTRKQQTASAPRLPANGSTQPGPVLRPLGTVPPLVEQVTGSGPPARQEDQVFAELVRAHRLRLAMTQEQLATASGVALRTIRNIETGHVATPRPTTVRLLANALKLHDTQRDQFCQRALSTPLDGKLPTPSPQPTQPSHTHPDTPQQPGRRTPHQHTAPDMQATPATDQLARGPAGQATDSTPEASGPLASCPDSCPPT